jgi:hypothetical protein
MSDSTFSPSNQQEFDDAIHQLVNSTRRPKEDGDVSNLENSLTRLIDLSGHDSNRWKLLVLAIAYKRYHMLSPQAREEGRDSCTAGDGERRIFYTAMRVLFAQSRSCHSSRESRLALEALGKLAPHAGGSRDICTILENMVLSLLEKGLEQTRTDMKTLVGTESLSMLVGLGVYFIQGKLQEDGSLASTVYLLQLAADTLDKDFDIILRNKKMTQEDLATAKDQEYELPSTLHIFLPHHNRGRSKKRKNNQGATKAKQVSSRQLASGVTEMLIWSRTSKAMSNPVFSDSYARFLKASSNKDDKTIKSNLFVMQTIIRNLRKELNSYARDQGFMLTDLFQLDSDSLDLSKVCRGKAGDMTNLSDLAKKKSSHKVLQLITLRYASNPDKITKYSSVNELIRQHSPQIDTSVSDVELGQVYRDIYISRVKATLTYLRGFIKDRNKTVMIASMETSQPNHVAAALVAAAMSTWELSLETTEQGDAVKLFLAGTERRMSCFQDLLTLLDEIVAGLTKSELDAPSFTDHAGIVTTKAVINMIERHLHDSDVLLLITSGDMRLPDDIMKALISRGCSLHCHDADDIGERLRREMAVKGDITISLAWDTGDDLDLHVMCPSGEEISFMNDVSNDGLCVLDVDMNACGPTSREPVENVFIGNLDRMTEAPKGKYKVFVQNYSYHEQGATKTTLIPFRVVIEKNGLKEKFAGQCQGSGKASNVTVHEFEYGGRTVPFPVEDEVKTAFGTSNMVNVTTSTGQTLESLSQLVQIAQQHEHLDAVRMLVDDDDDDEEMKGSGAQELDEQVETIAERPLMADHGKLEVTSRDRVNMLLARLPQRFHLLVGEAFGGPSLVETCAIEISRRMVADRIPISELKRNGYPPDFVEAVKAKMGETGPVGG